MLAAVTVTAATGGTNISADKAANATTPAYTTLGNIVIAENANSDFAASQTNTTLILTAPSGWQFNAGVGGVSYQNGRDITAASVVVTASTVTVTLSTDSNANKSDTLTISGIQVRATDGAVLPSSGNILRTVANPGTATIAGITNGTTNFGSLSQVVGNASKLAFTTQPGSATYGSALSPQPVVKSQDQFSNLSTTGLGTSKIVTLTLTLGTGSLLGTNTADIGTSAGNGTATFSGLSVNAVGTGKVITASASGLTSAVSDSFSITAGPAASLALNDPGDMYARTRLGYTVTRHDTGGNPTGVGTTTVYLYSSSTSGTKKFYDDSLSGSVITAIDITPGNSTANVWYYDETAGTYTITASDATPVPDGATGITDATDTVTVMPVATKFVIVDPTDGTVDAPITVTVRAEKPDNSVDTNYQSDVTLNVSGSATGGGVVDIVNGIGTKNISDTVAETINLSLTDSQATLLDVSSTQSVTFSGGAIAQFTLSHPATMAAGQRAAYTITREDQYGNASTVGTSTVYMYSSSTGAHKRFYNAATEGSIITSLQIQNGQSSAQAWYYDELPGSWSIIASDSTPAPDYNTGVNDAVDTLTVMAGPAASFTLSDVATMTAGTRAEYTVTRTDAFNNLVTSGPMTVYLSSDSTGAAPPAFYAVSSGGDTIASVLMADSQSAASFWYYDENIGTWTVTASDASPADGATGIIDATDALTVSPAPIVATRFVIDDPVDGTVDAPVTVTVKAKDASGNVDTTYQADVTLVASGSATLPASGLVDIVNGVGAIALSDTLAQAVSLSLTDSQATLLDVSSTQSVTFAPGAVTQLALTNPGDIAAGMRAGYTVSRKDQYNNAVTSGATTVELSSSSTGINKKFYDAGSGGSAITELVIPNGQSSAGFWAYDEKAGDWLISVGATGISGASDPITVQPAAIAKFLLDDPGNMTAHTRLGYTVTREDRFDNLVTTGVSLAYLYSSSSATTTAFYTASSGGSATNVATINDGSSSGAIWYYDETPGTWLVTVSDSASSPNGSTGIIDATDSVTVSAIPIVATRFVILPVSGVQVGTPASVTVEAQDDAGNVDTTIQSDVTLAATGSATGAGLVDVVNGVGSITLSDTVAETVALSLSDTQSTGLDVSSTQSLAFSAEPIAPSGGGAGVAAAPSIAGVRISGKAFPGAQVQILAVSSQGVHAQGQTVASANGSFSTLLGGLEAGANAFGLVGVDDAGRTTQTKVLNANYADRSAQLSLDAILLSPTLGLVHPTVRKGDVIGFVGSAMPGYTVGAQIDGKTIASTRVAADGSYKILATTAALSLGSHTARVRQLSPGGTYSEYAPQKVFTVTTLFTPQTDFNQDGVINVQDWSIFLSRWSSTSAAARKLDDLNGDGKTDVSDLSIFIRTLKQ